MKTSRACTGMLFLENDAFKFSKTAENRKSMCITCTIVPGLLELLFLQTSLLLTRNMSVKVAVELYYIFAKVSKFGYWQHFIDAEYIYIFIWKCMAHLSFSTFTLKTIIF